ncbi:MAG: TetR/AcrR family transcriptional regulator [Firmicutes bacterium]|nr:TetR/AcrR family transcriptional regulator [Bacillota bacterium]
MTKPNTKERVLMEALKLFSERGYDGVGVNQIAEAVGIKGPSLYYHFKSKEDILNELIATVQTHYEENFNPQDGISLYPKSVEELTEVSLRRIDFTMHDVQVKLVRKLMMIEQFRNEKLAKLASRHMLEGLVELYTVIFEQMIKDGIIRDGDPRLMAFEYTVPITSLIQLVDREPHREDEAFEMIKKHIDFCARNLAK